MIRNRYNRIPHPAINTKREMDNHDGTKTKIAQVNSQGDSGLVSKIKCSGLCI